MTNSRLAAANFALLGALSSELYGSRLTVISPLAIMEISLVKLRLSENQWKIVKTQTTTEGD